MCLERVVDEEPSLLCPLGIHPAVRIVDNVGIALRISVLCVSLIQEPLITLLELDTILVKLCIEPYC